MTDTAPASTSAETPPPAAPAPKNPPDTSWVTTTEIRHGNDSHGETFGSPAPVERRDGR